MQNPLFIERSAAYNSRRSTDKMFTAPAEFLNDATGGDKYRDGYISINPDKMQYAYEYFLGGLGRFGSQSVDITSRMLMDEDFRKQDLPIVGSFFETPSEYEDRFEFYANFEETQKIMKRFNDAMDSRSVEELRQLREEYKSFANIIDPAYGFNGKAFYKVADKDLRRIRKARKLLESQTYELGSPSEDRRRANLERLDKQENKVFDMFNKAFREAERNAK